MKKIITILFVALTFITTPLVGIENAKAATRSNVTLLSTQTSSSTSRIDVTGSMYLTISNWGTKDIKYTIFKSGSAYISGIVEGRDSYINKSLSLPSDEYSLRLYCGVYSRTTGCNATGAIEDN